MSHLLFIYICLFWGGSFLLMKKASAVWGPMGVGSWRLIAGSAILLLVWITRRQRWPLARRDLPGLALVALVSYAWPFAVQPWFIHKHNNSALMGILIAFVPLLTIVVSVPMLGVRPTARQTVGVFVGLGFLVWLMGDAAVAQKIPWTHLLIAGSVPLNYAIANTFMKRRFDGVPTIPLTASTLGVGAVVLFPLSLIFENVQTGPRLTHGVAAMVVLGIFCTGFAYLFFYRLVQKHGPLHAGMATYVIPLVAMACGWLDGEELRGRQLFIVLGVLAAVALVQWSGKSRVPEVVEV